MNDYPRFVAVGEQALLIEFGDRIEDRLNARVLQLAAALDGLTGVEEIIPTYRSLTVVFDPLTVAYNALCEQVSARLNLSCGRPISRRRWRVPVCYGGEYGEDLAALAQCHRMTPEQVIALHSGASYRVYMVGFLPGFAYLGGLPVPLHTPRRLSPRGMTPASSINIGGQQTAVSSVPGPSGWHLIGRTPWRTFDPARRQACLFRPGDEIRFDPISAGDFSRLADDCASPDWLPAPEAA
ncbi:5-oxoprolinase subunit PxpB [Martelella alba]|uniref:5-oxoprolinase subunit PxpB n=1 Tax=Martelella alba TaxID=2590451 RepID=A0ABY2STY4_9HYPH|nr:5-oxoprolinase subunit PxpB [Martelella alba]TKI08601.1 5-oxoprolinase subunit PxpB [Martelella alba]